jgi:hypothetical protein
MGNPLSALTLMQKPARTSIDPSAFDPLIAEGFIRQADLIKAFQEAVDGNISLESVLIDKYLVPKVQLGKASASFLTVLMFPMMIGWLWTTTC